MHMQKLLRRTAAVAVSLAGTFAICSVFVFGRIYLIVIGTVVLIIGVALWQTADQAGYNSTVGIAKLIEGTKLSLDEIFRELDGLDTPFGRAWMGRVKLLARPSIIFGPGKDGSFVYIYKKRRGILISQCTSSFWLRSAPYELNEITPESDASPVVGGIKGFSGDAHALVNELYARISGMEKR